MAQVCWLANCRVEIRPTGEASAFAGCNLVRSFISIN